MKQYSREDGLQCLAVKFDKSADEDPAFVFELISILNDAGLNAVHAKEETTDEWEEYIDEDGLTDARQVIILEHIKTQTNNDKLIIGDYIVARDGDVYTMDGDLFESVWTESITEDIEEWRWQPAKRIPYYKKAGLWEHVRDEDVISLDGGLSYFRMSERPKYAPYGQLYKSAVPILQEVK